MPTPTIPPIKKQYDNPVDWAFDNWKKIVGGFFGVIVALIIFFGSFYSVDAKERGLVKTFGAVSRVAEPGLHMKVPLVEKVERISTQVIWTSWERNGNTDSRMESYSHDQQPAHISAKVTWRAKTDEKSIVAINTQYGSLDGYAYSVIVPRTYQATKTVFGQFTAVSVIQKRSEFNAQVDAAVRAAIGDGPVIVESVQVQDITFSDAYEHAVEERMKAEVEVARVSQNLERERKTAEITVVQAKAQADSQLAVARAQAEAVKIKGEAEAAAIRARSAALQSNPSLVQLTLAEKWDGRLPSTMVPGAATPFIGVK